MSNDTFDDTSEPAEDRSIVKPGLLATGALALGATATATMAQDGSQGQPGLLYSYQYYPNTDFTVVDRLPQPSTVRLLQTADGETPPEIGDLGGWRGHVIQYDVGGDGGGIPAFLFLDGRRMAEGETSSTGGDAQMYTPELNLMRTTLGGEGGGEADGGTNGDQQNDSDGENGQAQEGTDAEGDGAQGDQGGQDGESDGLEISVSVNGDENESE